MNYHSLILFFEAAKPKTIVHVYLQNI